MTSIPLPQKTIKRGHIRVWTPSENTHRAQKRREGGALREQCELMTHRHLTGRVIATLPGGQHWARYTDCSGFVFESDTVDIDTAMLLLMLHAPSHYDHIRHARSRTERLSFKSAAWNMKHRLKHEPRGVQSRKVVFAGMVANKHVYLDDLRTTIDVTVRDISAFIHAPFDSVPVYNVQVFDLSGTQASINTEVLAA